MRSRKAAVVVITMKILVRIQGSGSKVNGTGWLQMYSLGRRGKERWTGNQKTKAAVLGCSPVTEES